MWYNEQRGAREFSVECALIESVDLMTAKVKD
jgi:hypothetical protein